ncbi:MAG: regulatory protein RecX [Lachnospiraceae bacterium]|nr:regulatory protein RecX [Lachnospiraceae bacterium]
MIVTEISEATKAKYKVFIDSEFAFVLYKGELRTYGIRQGEVISEQAYTVIVQELLPKRAKLRCMNLLKSREYTKEQMRTKLRQGFYPEAVIDEAIAYVMSFGYIDDRRYVEQYIRYASQTKSRKQMEQDLLRKGVSKCDISDVFTQVYEDEDTDHETELIERLIEKRRYDSQSATLEEKQKMVSFLYRKGFSLDKIYKAVGRMD